MSQPSPPSYPLNKFCPRSGKPVARDSLAEYRGVTVGFCNPGCRDDFVAHVDNRPEVLFQGSIADALNHVGQLALLRRMAGSPIRGENYATAEIVTGRVGREQSQKRREFE